MTSHPDSSHRDRILAHPGLLVLALALGACTQDASTDPVAESDDGPELTNRLRIPPDVVNNLGISFETASRGKLGIWRQVPGQLEVPEHARWRVRAPARGRLVSVVARWQTVDPGDTLAALTTPELLHAQNRIEIARQELARTTAAMAATQARLSESEAYLEDATAFERASRERFDEITRLHDQGNALTQGELIAVRATVTDAGRARLEAALRRDELATGVATRAIQAEEARLAVQEELEELSVLTGIATEALQEAGADGVPSWRSLERIDVRAPAAGAITELWASAGDLLDAGDELVQLLDTTSLRFRGHLPEGDVGLMDIGDPVRIEFPSRSLPTIETTLSSRIPVADPVTRMAHVEAIVPNPEGRLADGLSVMAWIRIEESPGEEVLLPERCVVFDGLEAIVFKRAADDPNVAIRTPVELGKRARGLVEVFAGVMEGEQVVADGIHQLKQTGLGKAPEGGHFHADGTWHSDHK